MFWQTFLRAHWESIGAIDFFTTDVRTLGGLVRFYVLVVIELASRRVEVAGITPTPDTRFMRQVAHNLTDPIDGVLHGMRFVIMDKSGSPDLLCPP
jgi:hypothetical protein